MIRLVSLPKDADNSNFHNYGATCRTKTKTGGTQVPTRTPPDTQVGHRGDLPGALPWPWASEAQGMSSDWAIPKRRLRALQGRDCGVQEHLFCGRGAWPDGGVLHPKECGDNRREDGLREHHGKGHGGEAAVTGSITARLPTW